MMAPCVRAIVVEDGRVVLIKRQKGDSLYYTLPGGHIEPHELPEIALKREILEELSVQVTSARHVFTESASQRFGVQYIYICTVDSTSIALSEEADEQLQNRTGYNTYTPGWYDWNDVANLPVQSPALKAALLHHYYQGWPDHVVELTS